LQTIQTAEFKTQNSSKKLLPGDVPEAGTGAGNLLEDLSFDFEMNFKGSPKPFNDADVATGKSKPKGRDYFLEAALRATSPTQSQDAITIEGFETPRAPAPSRVLDYI